MARRRKYPPITLGKDALYHAWVVVGAKPNGRPDQRHVKRKTIEEVEERVDELLDQKKAGAVVKAGRGVSLQEWLETYLETVASRRCDPTTVTGYRTYMRNYVYPVAGKVRIDRLTPEHIDRIYLAMQDAGRAQATIVQTHRILSRALEVAYRRGMTPRNAAKVIEDAPKAKRREMQALTEAEALAVLTAAERIRNSARWSVGLAIGLRQGEALGLRWSYVDLDAGTMDVFWQLHRRPFEHGCGSPATCGRKRAGNCPQRKQRLRTGEQPIAGGLILKAPKGSGKATIPIPSELVAELRRHREVQELEKVMAEGAYATHDLVFADVDGSPIDPARDWAEWKSLCKAAGVPDLPLHGGRHTAASLMIAQGVPIEVVQEVLRHSAIQVTRGYVHVASDSAKAATDRMGATLLRRPSTP
ncbi:site-specific integrase [Micromonospora lupini]|uniref:tyrosine-type recombinase/integrase n=1 Tax=Micromonospora lupini TaxID=285679 RepID=UPI0022545D29|nr:site-specific integrase [Micromonospora lupini]MCX5066962.1 site-specific integrase [Micromonospora lupini]